MLQFATHIHFILFRLLVFFYIKLLKTFRKKYCNKENHTTSEQKYEVTHICIHGSCMQTLSVWAVPRGNKICTVVTFTLTYWYETTAWFWGKFLDCSHIAVWFTELLWCMEGEEAELEALIHECTNHAPAPSGVLRNPPKNGCSTQLWTMCTAQAFCPGNTRLVLQTTNNAFRPQGKDVGFSEPTALIYSSAPTRLITC